MTPLRIYRGHHDGGTLAMGWRLADQHGDAPDYLARTDDADRTYPVHWDRAVVGGHDRPASLGNFAVRHRDRTQRSLHAVDVDRARDRYPHRDRPHARV